MSRNNSVPDLDDEDRLASSLNGGIDGAASHPRVPIEDVPADSIAVDSITTLEVGDEVWARFGRTWNKATVTSLFGRNSVKVRRQDDPSSREMLRPLSMIRLPPGRVESTPTIANSDPSNPDNIPLRVWTDSTGKHKTEARLIATADREVTLKRVDGKVVTIPLDRLSQQDQDYVASRQ